MTDLNNTPPSNGHSDDTGHDEAAPQFLQGNRLVSQDALIEKIEAQFYAETEGNITLFIAEEATQRDALRDVIDYVLATESISLTRIERVRVQEDLFRDLFGVGPLTALIGDDSLSEIEIRNPHEVFERHYGEDVKRSAVTFRDALHLERSLKRWLAPTGFDLLRDPFIETCTTLAGRTVRLTILTTPNNLVQSASLRLHPEHAPTLDTLIAAHMLDEEAATLLRSILSHEQGLMLAGDAGAGKTSLLQALAAELPPAELVAVERARELRLPDAVERLAATSEIAFPAQIEAATATRRQWMIMDEVRFDESAAMWTALTSDNRPRCLWVFRGSSEPLRLRTAFSMAVRRAQQGIEQMFINSALLDRLPFVAFVGRRENRYKLLKIGEWISAPDDSTTLQLSQLWPAERATASSRLT